MSLAPWLWVKLRRSCGPSNARCVLRQSIEAYRLTLRWKATWAECVVRLTASHTLLFGKFRIFLNAPTQVGIQEALDFAIHHRMETSHLKSGSRIFDALIGV
jgi:hypothetical protein